MAAERAQRMESSRFWQVIKQARQESRGDSERLVAALTISLSRLAREEIADFERMFRAFHRRSRRRDLLRAINALVQAQMLDGFEGLDEDEFDAFRAWLIAQGEGIFCEVMRTPERIGEFVEVKAGEWQLEALLYVAASVYEGRTGGALLEQLLAAEGEASSEGVLLAGYEWLAPDDFEQERLLRQLGVLARLASRLYRLHHQHITDLWGIDSFSGLSYREQAEQEWEQVQQALFTLQREAREEPPLLQRTTLSQILRLLQGSRLRLAQYFTEQADAQAMVADARLFHQLWLAINATARLLYRQLG